MTALYNDLGVNPDATPDEIKAAHRAAVKRLHPDNQDTGDREAFDKVQRAYVVLSDPAKRDRYDRTGEEPQRENPLAEAAALLVAAMDHVLSEVGDDFGTSDLVAKVRGVLLQERVAAEKVKAEALKNRLKLERIRSRLTFKGQGPNILATTFDGRVKALDQLSDEMVKRLDTIERANGMAADYVYAFDKPPEAPPYRAWTMDQTEIFGRAGRGMFFSTGGRP